MKTSRISLWRMLLAAAVTAAALSLSACVAPWQEATVETVTVGGVSLPQVSGFIKSSLRFQSVYISLRYTDN